MVNQEQVDSVMEGRLSPRILSMNIVLRSKIVTIISVYGLQNGKNKEKEVL